MGITEQKYQEMIEDIQECQSSEIYLAKPIDGSVLFELSGKKTRVLFTYLYGKKLNGDEMNQTEKWFDTLEEAMDSYTIEGMTLKDACKKYID